MMAAAADIEINKPFAGSYWVIPFISIAKELTVAAWAAVLKILKSVTANTMLLSINTVFEYPFSSLSLPVLKKDTTAVKKKIVIVNPPSAKHKPLMLELDSNWVVCAHGKKQPTRPTSARPITGILEVCM
jgi:hypothetical protein